MYKHSGELITKHINVSSAGVPNVILVNYN